MKKFWTYIKHKRKDIVGISSLKMDGKLYCDPVTKSNILNISVASSFRILGDMLSGPGALYGFNCFSNFVIPLQVISKDFIFGCYI
jgi:hypothetical protein